MCGISSVFQTEKFVMNIKKNYFNIFKGFFSPSDAGKQKLEK